MQEHRRYLRRFRQTGVGRFSAGIAGFLLRAFLVRLGPIDGHRGRFGFDTKNKRRENISWNNALEEYFSDNLPLPKLIIVDTTRRERVRIAGGIAKVVGVGTNIAAAQVAAVVEVLSPIGWLPRQRYTGGSILNRVEKGEEAG